MFLPAASAGASCRPPTTQSPCFDPDLVWVPAAPSPFVEIPAASALPRFALGVDVHYLTRPVVLAARSPDPHGREVVVVDDLVDAALSGAWSPAPRLELSAAIPFAPYRSGTGLRGATSQASTGIGSPRLRDVRIGAGHDLVRQRARGSFDFGAMSRLELTLPSGDAGELAGSGGVTLAPGLSLSVRHGRLLMAAYEVVRLRSPVELGGRRLGTQLVSSLGVGAAALDAGRLDVAIEAHVLPVPGQRGRALPGGAAITEITLVPAEWMGSVRTRAGSWMLAAGAGTAIPLSSESRRSGGGDVSTDAHAGLGSPRFRATLVVRWAPRSDP